MNDLKIRLEAALFLIFMNALKKVKKRKFLKNILFSFIYHLSFNHNISLRNIAIAFPEKDEKAVKKLNKEFVYTSLNHFVDFLNAGSITKNNLKDHFSIKNYHYFEKAFKKRKGIIVISAHFGNFLLYCNCSPLIIKTKTTAILDVESTPMLRNKIIKLLSAKGASIIGRREWHSCFYHLKNNEAFALVADQSTGNKSTAEVDFFNRKVKYPVGPAIISFKSRAPIVPTFIISHRSKYEIIFHKPLLIDYSKSLDENIKHIIQQWASLVESYIKKYPEQYFWRLQL